MKRTPLVIYHANCPDGFTAAWVACRALTDSFTVAGIPAPSGGDVDLVECKPMNYDDPAPDDGAVAGRDVYVVDFSFKRGDCERIYQAAAKLVVLDHHKTAEAELRDLHFALFDMERSGAGMTWDYFYPTEPRPWLVSYVEDRDLWRFALPYSREVNAAIACAPMNARAWDELYARGFDDARLLGAGALAFETSAATKIAKHARMIPFEGYTIPFVNVPPALTSVTVGLLAATAPFAVGWFQRADGAFQYSLRSRGDDAVDVSEIAKRYGGGGHRNAAGFTRSSFDQVGQ